MEVNEANLNSLTSYLQQTLSPDPNVRKPAESALEKVERQQGYQRLLMALLDPLNPIDLSIKVAGAIAFKNFIKRNWKTQEEGDDMIHSSDRDEVKRCIVDLMLKSHVSIQKQLSAAIAIIGKEDFPCKWPGLMNDMVTRFATGDFHVINGVLQTAASIFEKYSVEMKSQKLWEEIKMVLDTFCKPFTDLLNATMELAKEHASNKDALKVIFGSLCQISKIFYYLNYQDLPEFFEDNMQTWMTHFLTLLDADNKLLQSQDDDEPGVLEELKSQICDNIGLYAHKYEEEFSPFMKPFVMSVWNLLLSLGQQIKYDMLTSNAIQFLASVADRQQYKGLFEDNNTLASICEKIIMPNIEMREVDVELFEDNPEEYIRRDLEGSDVDTRRRAACDLVKGLSRFFEQNITMIFGSYVKCMLEQFSANPAQNWRKKDAAIYLVTSLATKAKTAKHGITQTNELVNLTDFCNQYILTELQSAAVDELPVVKASAIKYVMIFRSQLPQQLIKSCLPYLLNHLKAQSHVTHTYAAAAIDKLLIMKQNAGPATTALISAEDLAPVAEPLLHGLFGAFALQSSAENEYIMKCIMRSFSTLQVRVMPYLASLLPLLTQKLQQAAKNPTKPHYNHYLFESISLSIKIVCTSQPDAVQSFETVLFPVFQEILQQDVQEFMPYVFQIISLLLEFHNQAAVPQPYMELFHFLLMAVLWERAANIKALGRLLQSFIRKGSSQIVALDKLESLLGVCQKLIASKANDHEGFYILESLIEHTQPSVMSPYIDGIFTILFRRLTSSKTTKFIKNFLVFIFLYTIKFSGSSLQEVCDRIQPNLFGMVCDRLIIREVQKVSGCLERKICSVGLTKLLCETPCLLTGAYSSIWIPLLQALVSLFELPQDDTIREDDHFVDIEDTPGYQAAYSELVFAGKVEHDPVAEVADPKINLAHCLHKVSIASPGMLAPLVGQLPQQVQQHLQHYLQMANLSL